MKLYVMRHGPAADLAESGSDDDRALTASGRERVRGVAKALVDAQEAPLRILTSPLVRAVQTAEIVALVTKLDDREGKLEVRREVRPGGTRKPSSTPCSRKARSGRCWSATSRTCPTWMQALLGGFPRSFDKAMVVALHVPSDGGPTKLRFVLDPKTLPSGGPRHLKVGFVKLFQEETLLGCKVHADSSLGGEPPRMQSTGRIREKSIP